MSTQQVTIVIPFAGDMQPVEAELDASWGNVAKVTAGSWSSPPSLSCAVAHDDRPNRRPSMSSQPTVWLPRSDRAVTVALSAVVRYLTTATDSMIGMTSRSATHGGPARITASMPSARNPTAKCAIGEIRMTTGF